MGTWGIFELTVPVERVYPTNIAIDGRVAQVSETTLPSICRKESRTGMYTYSIIILYSTFILIYACSAEMRVGVYFGALTILSEEYKLYSEGAIS